jgi:hypothetical protein
VRVVYPVRAQRDDSMRSWLSGLLLLSLCAPLWPSAAAAQDDDVSLGNLARDVRRNKVQQPPHSEPPVIDNENLEQAMEDVTKLKPSDRLVFSLDPAGKGFKVSSPDVTCSLSFNGRAASLLIKPILVEDLPLSDLLKLDGPASIQDDHLQLEVFNGTDWELHEITIGLTLERKPGGSAEMAARARVIPAAEGLGPPAVEKHSDVTVLYHLKGLAKPFSTTTFRESIGAMLAADQDWHWSIVEAKGVRSEDPPQLPPEVLPPAPTISLPTPEAPSFESPSTIH